MFDFVDLILFGSLFLVDGFGSRGEVFPFLATEPRKISKRRIGVFDLDLFSTFGRVDDITTDSHRFDFIGQLLFGRQRSRERR